MSTKDRLVTTGGILVAVALVAASVSLSVFFLKGSVGLIRNAMPWAFTAGWFVLAINVLILLPMAIFRRLRQISASLIFASSFVYLLAMWLLGFVATYALWGGMAVVIGLFMFGVGIVPMAFFAGLFSGHWDVVAIIIGMAMLTVGSRLLAMKLDAAVV